MSPSYCQRALAGLLLCELPPGQGREVVFLPLLHFAVDLGYGRLDERTSAYQVLLNWLHQTSPEPPPGVDSREAVPILTAGVRRFSATPKLWSIELAGLFGPSAQSADPKLALALYDIAADATDSYHNDVQTAARKALLRVLGPKRRILPTW
jgi:hypothetical protein